jgi:FAD/FMN-containing dehydrogenase
VIECVRFARKHDVLVTIRGGGHSLPGKCISDGALMIDLSSMKGIRVDPARKTVRAQTGLTLGEFDPPGDKKRVCGDGPGAVN